ncbi:MAG: pyruvate kinase [Euryarchaeota archaeon]|nr:pyruvate kinase [Euryarchaeota archaeon]MDE2044302.1 pyruvate kinase [Thermoplasmata archaeon]
MPRTRILATIGPATLSEEAIRGLLAAGADAFRINFSHGDDDQHRLIVERARKVASAVGRSVTLVADLQGPKHRLGELRPEVWTLSAGEKIELRESKGPSDPPALPVDVEGFLKVLRPRQQVLLGDAALELLVEEVDKTRAVVRVVQGGNISSHQGVYFPGSTLRSEVLGKKDLQDLKLAVEEEVDWVALSFVASAADLRLARAHLKNLAPDRPPYLLAKIERAEALRNQVGILEESDGIMVARGDLGIEVPLASLAMVQKELVTAARRAAKPCVVATQMLLSMVKAPRPTRAEATDVANAVLDGADALMLSEETAVGEHPQEAVRFLAEIAEATEPALWRSPGGSFLGKEGELAGSELHGEEGAVAEAAVRLAARIGARAIVVPTHSGRTARLVARLRPKPPLLVLTSQAATQAAVGLLWGVRSRGVPAKLPLDGLREAARTAGIEELHLARGDRVVLTAGYPLEGRPTNLLNVVEI